MANDKGNEKLDLRIREKAVDSAKSEIDYKRDDLKRCEENFRSSRIRRDESHEYMKHAERELELAQHDLGLQKTRDAVVKSGGR